MLFMPKCVLQRLQSLNRWAAIRGMMALGEEKTGCQFTNRSTFMKSILEPGDKNQMEIFSPIGKWRIS
ncbi:hypothetical protein D3C77_581620 [compost metagenome]